VRERRSTARRCLRALRTALPGAYATALALSFLLGCSDNPIVIPPPEVVRLDIRNGHWTTFERWTYTGADSCVARADSLSDTTRVLCSVFTLDTPFSIDCDVERDGENVTYTCTSVADLEPCLILIELTGTGVVTDTTYVLDAVQVQRIDIKEPTNLDCEGLYGSSIDACTTLIHATGTWLYADSLSDAICEAEGDTDEDLSPFTSLISSLLRDSDPGN
jgi:hypothetical protein